MNAQEIKRLSADWIELVKTTTTPKMAERGGEFGKTDILSILDITFEMEDYEKFAGDEKWLSEIEAQVERGIALAKMWGYEMPIEPTANDISATTTTIRSWKPAGFTSATPKAVVSRTPTEENERLHKLFAKMDGWEAQGLDQWGLSPVRWDIIR